MVNDAAQKVPFNKNNFFTVEIWIWFIKLVKKFLTTTNQIYKRTKKTICKDFKALSSNVIHLSNSLLMILSVAIMRFLGLI